MKIRKQQITPILYCLPGIILLLILVFVPSIQALGYSFTDYSFGLDANFVGLRNYIEVLTDRSFWNVVLNNIIFVVGSLTFEIILGFASALLLNKRFHLQPLWVCLLLAPYAVSPVVAVQIWKYLLDPTYGIINYCLTCLGMKPVAWFSDKLTSFIPVCLVSIWKNFPFMMITVYAALTTVPTEVEEAAKIDGASGYTYFTKILLPLIKPSVSVGLIFRIVFLIRSFEIVWVFTAGGPGDSTEILAIDMYKEAFLYYDVGKGSAIGCLLLIITFLVSYHLIKNSNKSLLSKEGDTK